ncbi:DUF3634 family protein [Thioalkalivibrio sp. ALJ1]|uniref:DUF3634 family protein n=1 Tax=Thioalkalivibrio sp. ALJ1 TaxID=1158144 RepID=UPI00057113B8|nr:DUF3634 family protein [Thioalkalivibrio sp. ALJ1]
MLISLLLMIALLLIAGALLIWQASIIFSLDINGGKLRVRRGDPPMNFEHAARDVVRRYGIEKGRLTATRTSKGLKLRSSPSVPKEAHAELQTALQRVKVGRKRRKKRR